VWRLSTSASSQRAEKCKALAPKKLQELCSLLVTLLVQELDAR
jgi:hypothetical protein